MDYLITHAQENLWCNPGLDKHQIIEVTDSRLTGQWGVRKRVSVLSESITLPDPVDGPDFHCYMVGHLDTKKLGMSLPLDEWTTFSEICSKSDTRVDIFTDTGLRIHRDGVWIRKHNRRNVILAVNSELLSGLLEGEQVRLYVRFYTNSYLGDRDLHMTIFGQTNVKAGLWNNTWANYRKAVTASPDQVIMSIDGYCYDDTNFGTLARIVSGLGTYTLEVSIDPSVRAVHSWKVADLNSFVDGHGVSRYLLHPPKDNYHNIQFQDDVDLYLTYHHPSHGDKSVLIGRTVKDILTMITHRDYGLRVSILEPLAQLAFPGIPLSRLSIKAVLKHSSEVRNVISGAEQIGALYQLSDELIERALVGHIDSPDFWSATSLSVSPYIKTMTGTREDITVEQVVGAYGHWGIQEVVANTTYNVTKQLGIGYVQLSLALWASATIYEYDEQGVLLGAYQHIDGLRWYTRNASCATIEAFVGVGGPSLDQQRGTTATLVDGVGYSYLKRELVLGLPHGDWKPALPEDYTIANGVLTWNLNNLWSTCVQSDSSFLAVTYGVFATKGVYVVELKQVIGGDLVTLDVPPAEVDVWLHGHALVMGVDAFYEHPNLYITTNDYRTSTNGVLDYIQSVQVRARGVLGATGLGQYPEVGVVVDGKVSDNDLTDQHHNRVSRCVISGRVYHDHDKVTLEPGTLTMTKQSECVLPLEVEGKPYSISPVRAQVLVEMGYDNHSESVKAEARDQVITQYLTSHASPTPGIGSIYGNKHLVYSTYISSIIYGLVVGDISIPVGRLEDDDLLAILAPYDHLLNVDPVNRLKDHPLRQYFYFAAHPDVDDVTLNIVEYEAVNRVIDLKLNGTVELSTSVMIEGMTQ